MAPDVATIEPLEQEPRHVDPGSIEEEFSRMWRESARSTGSDASSVRLRVLNFVAYGGGQDALARFDAVMQLLPQRYPCRGILARAEAGRGRLDATIAGRCWHAAGDVRHMCSEEVRLVAGGAEPQELSSAVLALLVPELPVVVWLMADPDVRGALSRELTEAADRIFADTALAADTGACFRTLLRDMRAMDAGFTDLAWTRLDPWRALIAQFFDDETGMRELAQVAAIEIESAHDRIGAEPLLLAGWLVSRLGFSLADLAAEPHRIEATLYDGTRGVTLTIAPAKAAGGAALHAVRIRTAGCVMGVELHPESGHMHVREDWGGKQARRTVAVMAEDEPSLIVRALDDVSAPGVYADAAGSALALLGT